jgi:peptidoglycan/xylan/chitin deacetylase (PgdA/CDA1 family)
MNSGSGAGQGVSPAHITGAAAFLLAGAALFIRAELAAVPLGAFVLACLAAPFLPAAGFFLTVVSRGRGNRRQVALTFDDGPDPELTPRLLGLLARHRLPATFFVAGAKAEAHPDVIREILQQGHTLGNHSYRHDPLLMLRSRERLVDEICRAQEALARFGIRPLAFRPPVGITNPRLGGVLTALGMDCVTFSCRAGDFGNRLIGGLARRIFAKVHPGAIVLLHDVAPPSGRSDLWLGQVEEIVTGLAAEGYQIVPLAQLIGRPVMEAANGKEGCGP